jgi:hypothetical protein
MIVRTISRLAVVLEAVHGLVEPSGQIWVERPSDLSIHDCVLFLFGNAIFMQLHKIVNFIPSHEKALIKFFSYIQTVDLTLSIAS